MSKIKKFAKIKGFESEELKEILESIENKGFYVSNDGRPTCCEKVWGIFKIIEN